MRIGIIGAGQIGGTLARRLTALGHEVSPECRYEAVWLENRCYVPPLCHRG
jgi:phosphoglycerate dehydrogenase-like enzyme